MKILGKYVVGFIVSLVFVFSGVAVAQASTTVTVSSSSLVVGATAKAATWQSETFASPIPSGSMVFISMPGNSSANIITYTFRNASGQTVGNVNITGSGSGSVTLTGSASTLLWMSTSASFTYQGVQLSYGSPLTAPTVSYSGVTSTSATVSWSAVPGATAYDIEYGDGTVIKTGVTGTSYTLNGLTPGMSYSVKVAGSVSGGEGPFSSAVSFSTAVVPSSAPSGLVVSAVTSGSFKLSWQGVPYATGYRVYVDGVVSATTSLNSVALSPFVQGSSHSVTVVGFNQFGDGPSSLPVSVTLGTLVVPTGLSDSIGDSSAQLQWFPVSGAVKYKVYVNGSYVTSTNSNMVDLTGLTNGDTYSFQVSEVDAYGNESALSSSVSGRPQPPPVPVNGLSVLGGGDVLQAQWGGTMTPFNVVVKDGSGGTVFLGSVAGNMFDIPNVKKNTNYTVTVTDAGKNSLSMTVNSGAADVIFPPSLPSPTPVVQGMVSSFGSTGRYIFVLIAVAVALGIVLVGLVMVWRNFKKWNGRVGSPSVQSAAKDGSAPALSSSARGSFFNDVIRASFKDLGRSSRALSGARGKGKSGYSKGKPGYFKGKNGRSWWRNEDGSVVSYSKHKSQMASSKVPSSPKVPEPARTRSGYRIPKDHGAEGFFMTRSGRNMWRNADGSVVPYAGQDKRGFGKPKSGGSPSYRQAHSDKFAARKYWANQQRT